MIFLFLLFSILNMTISSNAYDPIWKYEKEAKQAADYPAILIRCEYDSIEKEDFLNNNEFKVTDSIKQIRFFILDSTTDIDIEFIKVLPPGSDTGNTYFVNPLTDVDGLPHGFYVTNIDAGRPIHLDIEGQWRIQLELNKSAAVYRDDGSGFDFSDMDHVVFLESGITTIQVLSSSVVEQRKAESQKSFPDIFSIILSYMPLIVPILLGGIISAISYTITKPKFDKWKEIRTIHRENLIEYIKRSLVNISFPYSQYQVRRNIGGTQGEKSLEPTIAHLFSYKSIKRDWQRMNSLVTNINEDLGRLQTLLRSRITSIMGEAELHEIDTKFSQLILKNVLANLLTFDSMTIEKDTKHNDIVFYLSNDKKTTTWIKRLNDLDQYYPKILELFDNQEFHELVNRIHQKKVELDQTRDSFKRELDDLLYKVDQGFILQGKCNDCPSFLRTKA